MLPGQQLDYARGLHVHWRYDFLYLSSLSGFEQSVSSGAVFPNTCRCVLCFLRAVIYLAQFRVVDAGWTSVRHLLAAQYFRWVTVLPYFAKSPC